MSTYPDDDPFIGREIDDRYRVMRQIGQGGMGTVYLAEHVVLEKRVALKILAPHLAGTPELVQRFVNEAKAISRIGHEHIVDVVDVGTTHLGSVYFVMELLSGRDLRAVIRDEGLIGWERVCRIGAQICEALFAAHEKGIIHRDLKPENVFLIDRGGNAEFVKVLDFGIAKFTSFEPRTAGSTGPQLTRAGMVMGTPEYMAPEQAKGEKADHRMDVYSVGCILYELLTCSLPFDADTAIAVLLKQINEPPEPIARRRPAARVPADVEALVMRALAKDPGARFPTMKDLSRALAALTGTFEPAQPATAKRRLATEQVALAEARSALFRGELDAAVTLAEEAVQTAGGIDAAELQPFAELLQRIFTQRIGDLTRRVRISGVPEDVDSRATFLLSRIDRAIPIEDLIAVSGMPHLEALRLIAHLLRRKTLTVE